MRQPMAQLLFYIALALCCSISSALKCGRPSVQPNLNSINRIVGGGVLSPHSQPWMAHIRVKVGNQIGTCGGTLISPRSDSKSNLVLTAAHCFQIGSKVVNPADVTVVLGGHDMSKQNEPGREQLEVQEIITDGYDPKTQQNDIAILVLKKFVTFGRNIQHACLSKKKMDKIECYAVGWGATEKNGADSPVLRAVPANILDDSRCQMPHFNKEKQFCAGTLTGGKDSCQGDSGGPLICTSDREKYVQVGIISFGKGCGKKNQAGFYTRVAAYEKWIEKTAKTRGK
uniref:limulus clotting factor C n=1 Tax=Trichuris muris TaxID=70415 RepID=A0A5S6QUX9_TRIMR